jgi:hypothetical protein
MKLPHQKKEQQPGLTIKIVDAEFFMRSPRIEFHYIDDLCRIN